jgi:hypothetical protein
MARKTVRVSDQSGDVVPDGKGAVLRITYTDARRGVQQADLTDKEAEAISKATNAKSVARRGRKPKAASSKGTETPRGHMR